MGRESVNQNWQFKRDEGGMFAMPDPPVTVHLPHDAMILEPRDKDNLTGNSGGFFRGEITAIQRHFRFRRSGEWHN